MTSYADKLLSEGEEVVLRARQHPLATIIEARWPWLLFLVSIVVLVFSQGMNDGQFRTILSYVVLGGIVISLLWLGKVYLSWINQEYLITNRRVMKVEGIINKRSADSSLEKINDAVLTQDLWGRMFNYGDLDILTAADVAIDQYRMLNAAPRFKREMLNQKHDLEGDYARPLPGPPIRGGVAMPPPAAPAPPPREMSADEVTRALSGLADLRDRNAISPEEYEAKKAQLLARL